MTTDKPPLYVMTKEEAVAALDRDPATVAINFRDLPHFTGLSKKKINREIAAGRLKVMGWEAHNASGQIIGYDYLHVRASDLIEWMTERELHKRKGPGVTPAPRTH